YPQGAYLAVDSAVGSLIDFYNVQFYNQDDSAYETCETLFYKSDGWATQSSVFQIAAQGVALNKIVIGKPVTAKGVDSGSTGYVDTATLQSCISQAVSNGWSAGVMGWRFGLDTQGQWAAALAPAF
ncbi:hypothetical protein HK100_008289, partial [Physocladia obscura]